MGNSSSEGFGTSIGMTVIGGEPVEANPGRFWAIADDEETVITGEDVEPVTRASTYLACSPASDGRTMVEAATSVLRRRE
jgi:hypothetical protein